MNDKLVDKVAIPNGSTNDPPEPAVRIRKRIKRKSLEKMMLCLDAMMTIAEVTIRFGNGKREHSNEGEKLGEWDRRRWRGRSIS